jgi:hypothetical protein
MINFIGIGAQKSGTSWVYSCLYDHPEICAPIKELHFFSRPRWSKGVAWYENHFRSCDHGVLRGEFSTSYLYTPGTAERIKSLYPEVKLIAILRNPIDRAFSQYRNAIKGGEIHESCTFDTYCKTEKSVLEQGLYAEQLARYDALFTREQILVLVYEDTKKDPVGFMRRIYEFLGVDATFVSGMVQSEVNIARTPRKVWVDRLMHHIAEWLRKAGFDRLVHLVRTTGLPDVVRRYNTKLPTEVAHTTSFDREPLRAYFTEDVLKLTARLGRDIGKEWGIT